MANYTPTKWVDNVTPLSAEKMNNIEQGIKEAKNIGLVNLYNGTKDFSGSDWVNTSNYISNETYKGFRVWKKTNAWGGACQTIDAVEGEQYVFSCWAKVATSASGVTATAQFFTRNNDQTNGNNSTQDGKMQTVSSEWQRIVIPFTVITTGTMQPRIENTKANSGGLYVCGIKLEKGTVATDWFCSVNDLDNVGTTIWQNASVLASFAATTITVDAGFAPRKYEILYYDSTDSSVLHSSGRLSIGTKCAIDGVGLNSSGEIVSFTRYIEVTKNNIVIGEGKIFHPTNKATAQSNYWAIPYKVIFYP